MIDMSTNDGLYALAPLAGWAETHSPKARVGRFGRLATRFLAWRAQRQTVRLLNRVDGATLRDLGITDVESAVYGDPSDRMRGYDAGWWRKTSR